MRTEDRSRNVDRRRVLYEPVDIIGEGHEAMGEGGKSLYDLCRIHCRMLMEEVW